MPRRKKDQVRPPPAEIENALPAEQHQMLVQMLKKVTAHMDKQNAARKEVSDFHKKCGKNQARDMNKKERNEAKELYNRHLNELENGNNYIEELLNSMKVWRNNAICDARDRGEINTIEVMKLRQGCLPLINPEIVAKPYGVGAIGWPEDKRLEKHEEVAAFVEEAKTWILAEVVGAVSNHRYECIDIDDNDRKMSVFSRKQLIPLPKYTVNYQKYPHMALQKNTPVLAIFPGTTCFYDGKVEAPPANASGMYQIRFYDSTAESNWSEPREIPERYVLGYKRNPKIYIRPEKRVELGIQKPKDPQTPKKQNCKPEKSKEISKTNKTIIEPVEDKDVPGPAPKPAFYYESAEDDIKVRKQRRKKNATEKPKKIKIIRAKVPPHKKKISTRLFGKRRVKRKPKNTTGLKTEHTAINEPKSTEGCKEKAEGNEQGGEDAFEDAMDNFTNVGQYGLEEELEETDSEVEQKQEEKQDKKEFPETAQEESLDHDPQEGTSGPLRYPSDSESEYDYMNKRSDSSDSDVQSGISISDNERLQRGYETEDEAED